MQEQLVYNHPIPWKEERRQGSMILFRQLWLLLTLVFSPHQFVMSRQTPVSRRCASKPATHAAHTSLWVCVECISTSAQPTSDKTEADKHQTPSARPPPCLSVLSMPSKPAALRLSAMSDATRRCLHHSVCWQPIRVAVRSCASHVTRLLNCTFIRDLHTQEIGFPVYGAASALLFAWFATWRSSTCACRCKGIAGSTQIKAK